MAPKCTQLFGNWLLFKGVQAQPRPHYPAGSHLGYSCTLTLHQGQHAYHFSYLLESIMLMIKILVQKFYLLYIVHSFQMMVNTTRNQCWNKLNIALNVLLQELTLEYDSDYLLSLCFMYFLHLNFHLYHWYV